MTIQELLAEAKKIKKQKELQKKKADDSTAERELLLQIVYEGDLKIFKRVDKTL